MPKGNDVNNKSLSPNVKKIFIFTAFMWSMFQLWIASELPYVFTDFIPVLNNIDTRSIHLSFALFLGFLLFPTFTSTKEGTSIIGWVLAVTGVCSAMYLSIFANDIASISRSGNPNLTDLIISGVGIFIVLECTRRVLGWPLTIIATIFLLYIFFGQFAPNIIAWKGASFSRAMSHIWLTQEGVFGVAVGVSTSIIFLFVLFGSLLERTGAGNYFIWVSYALIGHMRGGPAKAAVVSSALTGIISGSSISNVVTTGTFTIPLMKKIGFSAEKAGAIEVAASTNGQLTPPVMGAAIFLIMEFVGIGYIEVVKHAILPAIISYIALIYIVHLESVKAGFKAKTKIHTTSIFTKLFNFVTIVLICSIISLVLYYGFNWLKIVLPHSTIYIAFLLFIISYVVLVRLATKYPELKDITKINKLPRVRPTVMSGLYFVLPIIVLIWCLVVERFSSSLSAFWANMAIIFILLTHNFIKQFFRGRGYHSCYTKSIQDLLYGLVNGGKNMVNITIATAAAGIIVGAVTLTGIGLIMAELVDFISGENLLLTLLFTAIISLVLGLGLPTTANYIVVSSLMVPVIISISGNYGLSVPLIAVHLFVFYFGILADDTPPVGLAAYAASAISGGDPIKTGIQSFKYDIRTIILPFMFIFNPELLLINVTSFWHLLMIIIGSIIAILAFASSTQSFMLIKNKLWENIVLLLVAWILFTPGFFMNFISPEFKQLPANQIYNVAANADAIKLRIIGMNIDGKKLDRIIFLKLNGKDPIEKIKNTGISFYNNNNNLIISDVEFYSPAYHQQIEKNFIINGVFVKNDRLDEHIFYLPAILLLITVLLNQRNRRLKYNIQKTTE